MERYVENARKMLFDWTGNSYSFGFDVLSKVGELAGQYGKKALLIVADLEEAWTAGIQKSVSDSLKEKEVAYEAVTGARPNAPREDVYRLALHVARSRPEVIISVGGGQHHRRRQGSECSINLFSRGCAEFSCCFRGHGRHCRSLFRRWEREQS